MLHGPGLRHKLSAIAAELEIADASTSSSMRVLRRAHELMGTAAIGTLPQQADALLLALGITADLPSTPPPSPPPAAFNVALPAITSPRAHEEHHAATRVQAVYRGKATKDELNRQHTAASTIQSTYRGRRERIQTAELRMSQKKAFAELRAQQLALAEQESASTPLFKRELPMDLRHRIGRLLDKPRSSPWALAVLVLLILSIIASLMSFFLLTMPEFSAVPGETDKDVRVLEATCAVIFTIELLLRSYVATLDLKRLLLLEPTYWIDVVCVVPFYVELGVRSFGGATAELPLAFKILSLFRLLRILKLLRHYSGWRVLLIALNNAWRALLVPAFAMLMTIFILAGALFLVEVDAVGSDDDGAGVGAGASTGFRSGWETMWVCFWLVATLGYDGYLGSGAVGGRLVIATALMCGLLFTTMPITIIGEAFRAAWEKKELIEVQMKIQELLIDRGLKLDELHRIFAEFDTSGDMQLDWAEFKGALKKLGVRVPLVKMRALFAMFDEDETGQVDYMEFCRLLYPDHDMMAAAASYELDTPRDERQAASSSILAAALAASSSSVKVHPTPPLERLNTSSGL